MVSIGSKCMIQTHVYMLIVQDMWKNSLNHSNIIAKQCQIAHASIYFNKCKMLHMSNDFNILKWMVQLIYTLIIEKNSKFLLTHYNALCK
jgi:hypothetical protein